MIRGLGAALVTFGYLAMIAGAIAAAYPGSSLEGDGVAEAFWLCFALGAPFVFLGAGMRNSGRGPSTVAKSILYSLLGLMIADGVALVLLR